MRHRCPNAIPLRGMMLPNFKLVFRGVADITEEPDAEVPVGLFEITHDCETALDRYEGFPRLYSKIHFEMDEKLMMAYVMNQRDIRPPSSGYYAGIRRGYFNFGLDVSYLEQARRHSYSHQTFGDLLPD